MREDVKKYMLGLLHTGHCKEMFKALACKYCGTKFKKAEAEYNRLRKEKPELFIRKTPEFQPSPELKNMFDKLTDRVRNDKLYQEHLRLSLKGTPEEQKRETNRANSGYYKRHYDSSN